MYMNILTDIPTDLPNLCFKQSTAIFRVPKHLCSIGNSCVSSRYRLQNRNFKCADMTPSYYLYATPCRYTCTCICGMDLVTCPDPPEVEQSLEFSNFLVTDYLKFNLIGHCIYSSFKFHSKLTNRLHMYKATCSNIAEGLKSDWSLEISKQGMLFLTRKFIENTRRSFVGRVWRSGYETSAHTCKS